MRSHDPLYPDLGNTPPSASRSCHPIDEGPLIENETAAQAGTLNGGEMEKATSHSQHHDYMTAPEITRPQSLRSPARGSVEEVLANLYPILWLHVGPDELLGSSRPSNGGAP